MTCDSMEYPPKTRAPILRMKNVQIVNGGQTSNALFEAATTDPDRFRNVLVLIRVYETKQYEMSLKIAISTNSQIPIRSRDLRSNDEVQRKLEESFKDFGLFYERKMDNIMIKIKIYVLMLC
jgi:AIPR protein